MHLESELHKCRGTIRRKRVHRRKVAASGGGGGLRARSHISSTLSISTRDGESCAKMKVVLSLWSTFHAGVNKPVYPASKRLRVNYKPLLVPSPVTYAIPVFSYDNIIIINKVKYCTQENWQGRFWFLLLESSPTFHK